jgi:putative membrane protein
MIKAHYAMLLGCLAFSGAIVSVASARTGPMSAQTFVRDASVGNQFEIMSSQLALKKTQNDDVKQFAQHMIDDHSRVRDQLKALASSARGMPQPSAKLDAKHQKLLDALKSAKSDFDKRYIDTQVDAHNEAVTLFDNYSKNGDNDVLKKFATDTLPTLKEHQQQIGQIKSSYGGGP